MQVFQKALEDCTSKLASVETMYKSWPILGVSDSTKGLQELRVNNEIVIVINVL